MEHYLFLVALLQVLTSQVLAHYSFSRLLVNGSSSKDWEYIRKPTQLATPVYIVDKINTDIRCGYGALTSGVGVKTATVLAGDTIGFGTQTEDPRYAIGIYHDGPAQAYLSRVALSESLELYKGDGAWFKIGEYGYVDQYTWKLHGLGGPDPLPPYMFMNFTIPKSTPPGKYLMRAEQMNLRDPGYKDTQFFLSCAHLEIIGLGGGTPEPLVYFPEAYDPYDPSLAVPKNRTWGPLQGMNLSGYINPGPSVWVG